MEENIVLKEESTIKKKKGKNKTTRYLLNLVLILVLTVGYSTFTLWNTFGEVLAALQSPQANYNYAIIIVLLLIGFYFFDGVILFFFARLYTRTYKLHRGIANAFIGQFYANVTPSGSGRQFAQVVTYNKQGVNVSAGASIVVMYYILYQIVLIIFGLISVLFNIRMFIESPPLNLLGLNVPLWLFAVAGLFISGSIIFFMLVVSLSRKLHAFFIEKGINLLAKIKLIRNPEQRKKKLIISTENFRIELRRLSSNIPATIAILVLFIFKFICLYSTSYVVGVMLDPTLATPSIYFASLTRTSFLQMVIGIVPIPGGAGVTEYLYEVMFLPIFNNEIGLTRAIQIIWRFATFYSGLIVGGFVSALYRSSMEDLIDPSTGKVKTFTDLQVETFAERKISSDTAYETSKLSLREIKARLAKDTKKGGRKK